MCEVCVVYVWICVLYVEVLCPLCPERSFLCHNLPKEEDKEEDSVDLTHTAAASSARAIEKNNGHIHNVMGIKL